MVSAICHFKTKLDTELTLLGAAELGLEPMTPEPVNFISFRMQRPGLGDSQRLWDAVV
jgi:hypothetical protein